MCEGAYLHALLHDLCGVKRFARYFSRFVCERAYLRALLHDLCGVKHFAHYFSRFMCERAYLRALLHVFVWDGTLCALFFAICVRKSIFTRTSTRFRVGWNTLRVIFHYLCARERSCTHFYAICVGWNTLRVFSAICVRKSMLPRTSMWFRV